MCECRLVISLFVTFIFVSCVREIDSAVGLVDNDVVSYLLLIITYQLSIGHDCTAVVH